MTALARRIGRNIVQALLTILAIVVLSFFLLRAAPGDLADVLAGQSGAAIYKQLSDYRTGSRTNQLMTDIAKALDETTLADVAAYYAAQPKRNANPATLAESPEAIVRLVELGDPNRNIPPCAACHRQGSGGPIETPILSEQGRDYLALQLRMYASGERRNDVYGRMRTIAAKLTPTEINGLATYYRAGFK